MFSPIPTPECTDDRDTDMSAFFTSENAMQIFIPINLPDLTLIRGHSRQQQQRIYCSHILILFCHNFRSHQTNGNTFVNKVRIQSYYFCNLLTLTLNTVPRACPITKILFRCFCAMLNNRLKILNE